MGITASREISSTVGAGETSFPRSATLPVGLRGFGKKFSMRSPPHGLGLDSSFSVKLTKSKRLDEALDESKVEMVQKELTEKYENGVDEEEMPEETTEVFVEKLLIKLMEDALANIPNTNKTLPSVFRDLTKRHNFAKRIRQSFRVLVTSKKTEEHEDEKVQGDFKETKQSETGESAEAGSSLNNISNRSLLLSFKDFDLSASKKQIQSNIKRLISRSKKPKKETLKVINSILDDIISDVEGEDGSSSAKKKEPNLQVEIPSGDLDKSND